MNIYFLRHGETEENYKKTYYGRIDAGLTQKGIKQAMHARELLKNKVFDKVFISERSRTFETANIVFNNQNTKFIKDSRINERDFGVFEGKTYEEIKQQYPSETELWNSNWKEFCPMGGESYITFYKRVKDFIQCITKSNCENILVVTHGGVIRAAYCYILDETLDFYWKFSSKNGDIALVKYEYGNFFIDSIVHVD